MELKQALLEGLKRLFATMLLAVIPLVIDGLQKGRVDWNSVGVAGAIAGLIFIDKVLHESDVKINGLLPF